MKSFGRWLRDLPVSLPSREDNAVTRAAGIAMGRLKEWSGKLEDVRQITKSAQGSLSSRSVKSLFGETFNISATRIEKYNSCHFSYFMQYGLKARQRKKQDLKPEMEPSFTTSLKTLPGRRKNWAVSRPATQINAGSWRVEFMDQYARSFWETRKRAKGSCFCSRV